MQQKTVSLETARKMKEAGWTQSGSDFVWLPKGGRTCVGYCDRGLTHEHYSGGLKTREMEENRLIYTKSVYETSNLGTSIGEGEYGDDNTVHHLDFIAAPDIQDLLEALPDFCGVVRHVRGFQAYKMGTDRDFTSGSPAEALAQLWLDLKTKNLI